MAMIRQGNKSVLLVVDVQKGVVRSAYNRDEIVNNVNGMVDKARCANVPIIWVQHSDDGLILKSTEWEIVSELKPASNDYYVAKRYNSSFEETELEQLLQTLGITKIVLVGAATNWCIRATAYGALDRGYDVCLIGDAHTTESIEFKDGKRMEAKDMIAELNIALTWLSYPGRTNECKKTSEYSF